MDAVAGLGIPAATTVATAEAAATLTTLPWPASSPLHLSSRWVTHQSRAPQQALAGASAIRTGGFAAGRRTRRSRQVSATV